MASREDSIAKIRNAAYARQRFLDMMYARTEAEEAERQAAADSELAASNKNWMDEGMQGAAMGGSVGGPWGALVGGIVGTIGGQKKAYDQRRKEGKGRFESFWRTSFDTPFGTSKLNATNMSDGASAFGSSKNAYDRQQAMQSTAADASLRNREAQQLELEQTIARGDTYGSKYRNYQIAKPKVQQTQMQDPDAEMYYRGVDRPDWY